MRKIKILMLVMTIGIVGSIVSSCGSGVDHSDPRSVAEAALDYYQKGDFKKLKTLLDPANTYGHSEMDRMIAISEKHLAEHPDDKPQPTGFTFKEMKDDLRGGKFTEATTTARVIFDTEKWPSRVVVDLVDGKWYFERFK